jgi:hypothetical protein
MSQSLEALFGVPKKEEKTPQVVMPPVVVEPKVEEKTTTPTPEIKTPETKTPEAKPSVGLASLLPQAPTPPAPMENPLLKQGISIFQRNQPDMPIIPLPIIPDKFDMEPEKPSTLKYLTLFGGKNSGKTVVALSFPGKITALSFDHKTVPTWVDMFNSDPRITIYDGIKYMDYSSPDASLISSEICFRYIFAILDKIKSEGEENYPDWFLIDGLEEYMKISENVMRWRNGLKMTQGVEWQFWKDRRLYTKQLFLKLATLVKKGVIFCTKYETEDTLIVNGITKERKKKPIWLDIIEEQTDIVIETWSTEDKMSGNVRFEAHITASKYASFPTGRKVDVTADAGKVQAYKQLCKDAI